MKFSYDEIKRKIYILAAVLFVVIAGIIYVVKQSGSNDVDRSVSAGELTDEYTSGDEYAGEVSEKEDKAVKGDTDPGESERGAPDNNNGDLEYGSDNSGKIVVHVCGAVVSPGLYELDPSDRIGDAIEAAGGFSKKAVQDYLNLAEPLYDGEKITVYTKKQIKKMSGSSSDGSGSLETGQSGNTPASSKMNINTASKEELMTLPGIGESKAEAIISYREGNGPFKDIKDIMNISGIKEGVYSKIADSITI